MIEQDKINDLKNRWYYDDISLPLTPVKPLAAAI
jgi:hypothetical protein